MKAVNEMKRLATKVDEMQKQRIALHKELRDAVQNDDITQSLVVTQESDIDALFQREIAKHNKMVKNKFYIVFLSVSCRMAKLTKLNLFSDPGY